MKSKPAPSECPVCGEPLKPQFQACPECGACHQTGWREEAEETDIASALGIDPDDEFDYEAFMKKEFSKKTGPPRGIPAWAWAVAILILLAYVARIFF